MKQLLVGDQVLPIDMVADLMRQSGIARLVFHPQGQIAEIVLGDAPSPVAAAPVEEKKQLTAKELEEAAKKAQLEFEQLLFASSSA